MPGRPIFDRVTRTYRVADLIDVLDEAVSPPSDEELMQFRFRPGDRVVVLDTGEEGVVIRGRKVNVVIPTAKR